MAAFTRLVSVLIAALGIGADQVPTAEQARREVIAACKDHESMMERRLEAMRKAPGGALSELAIDVQRYRIALLRYDLAMYERKPEEQVRQARVTVELWERQVERIRKLSDAGAAAPTEMANEEYRLACFRSLLAMVSGNDREALKHLRVVIASADKRLVDLKKLLEAAAVSEREVEDEQRRVAFARHVKARLEGDAEDAARSLRHVIDLDVKLLDRVVKLRQSGSASENEELLVRDRLSRSRFRLAHLEDNRMAAIEQLEQQVEYRDKLLANVKAGGGSEDQIAGMKHALAHSRDRLASGRAGLAKVVEDHPIGTSCDRSARGLVRPGMA